MDSESGFFSKGDAKARVHVDMDSFHDFRRVYESTRGFTRLFVAGKNGRLFMLKTLKAAYADDPVGRAALRKEYDTAFGIDSAYVAATYDYVDIEGLGMSIVMEYCVGESLADYIENKRRLSDRDVQSIVYGLLRGLEDIHSRGIVHRDIKPANVIYSSATNSLKIIDFGLAHSERHYVFGEAAGTRGFESPDVHRSDHKPTADDDYYSAAMTLSAISLLCRPAMNARLSGIVRALSAKRILTAEQARRMLEGHPVRRALIWAVPAVCVLALLVWKSCGRDAEPENVAPTRQYTVTAPDNETDTGTTEPATPAPTAEPPHDGPSPSSTKTQGQYNYPDINGVAFDEARLTKNYRKSEFDNFVILQTDGYLTGCILNQLSDSKTPRSKAAAKRAFESPDSVWDNVRKHVTRKFASPDLRRAEGLVTQRYIYWVCEGYLPATITDAYPEYR